ncbi:MAG: thiol:disulfide interchange protein DsbA/DsbL [Gammaproteobacteria bacterium]|nr:thiol:disulfide interchange protein DsbA/DsbL [Gammaproteobacteria bacterium]
MKHVLAIFFAAAVGWNYTASAAEERYQEGTHYDVIVPAQPTSAGPGEVEVVEFFWYGCPHCFAFEPFVEGWLENKPDNIKFLRIPGILNPSWQAHARAFYTAEALGVFDQVHKPLFAAIHTDRRQIFSENELADFFNEAAGVSEEDFKKTFNSFAVTTKLQRADVLARRFRLMGVPAVVVNGKYKVNASAAGSYQGILDIARFLANKESSAQN